jgi:HPt (histidine-containing phosphotransfer) domain-containing protein
MYLEDSKTLLERLRLAVSAQDAHALREAAHALKSTSANLGAAALADLCRELEEMGRRQEVEGAGALFERVLAAYPSVCTQLQMECRGGGATDEGVA